MPEAYDLVWRESPSASMAKERGGTRFGHVLPDSPPGFLLLEFAGGVRVVAEDEFHREYAFWSWRDLPPTPSTNGVLDFIRGVELAVVAEAYPFFRLPFQPLPHQIRAVEQLLHRGPSVTAPDRNRLFLADEVGMGKTLSAGLAIWTLLSKDPAARILVTCPAPLVRQWCDELWKRFRLDFREYREGEAHGGCLVASIDSLKRSRMEAGAEAWRFGMIVVDECHELRYFRNGGPNPSLRYQCVEALIASAQPETVLFLSGTPWSASLRDFAALVKLLAPRCFQAALKQCRLVSKWPEIQEREAGDLVLALHENGFRDLFLRRSAEEILGGRTRQRIPPTTTRQVRVRLSLRERLWLWRLRRALRTAGEDEALVQACFVLRAKATSCLPAALEALSKKEGGAAMAIHRRRPALAAKLCQNQVPRDSKFLALCRWIDKETRSLAKWKLPASETVGPAAKFVIFVNFRSTAAYLVDRLNTRFGNETNPRPARLLNPLEEHAESLLASFRQDLRFLVCLPSSGRGLNLQAATVLVNYDMPLNPAELPQRAGRVCRLGQSQPTKILNFTPSDDPDQPYVEKVLKYLAGEIRAQAQEGKGRKESAAEADVLRLLGHTDEFGRVFREMWMLALSGKPWHGANERLRNLQASFGSILALCSPPVSAKVAPAKTPAGLPTPELRASLVALVENFLRGLADKGWLALRASRDALQLGPGRLPLPSLQAGPVKCTLSAEESFARGHTLLGVGSPLLAEMLDAVVTMQRAPLLLQADLRLRHLPRFQGMLFCYRVSPSGEETAHEGTALPCLSNVLLDREGRELPAAENLSTLLSGARQPLARADYNRIIEEQIPGNRLYRLALACAQRRFSANTSAAPHINPVAIIYIFNEPGFISRINRLFRREKSLG